MKMYLVRLSGAILGMCLAFLLVINVYAITAPTSITISNVKAFRNLAETGDMLVVFHYAMPYASDNYSTTPASESVIFKLYDSDNATIKQTGSPYVNPFFNSNGYGEGVGSFYLEVADAPDWLSAITIQVAGLPAFFTLSKNYTLTTSDYVTQTSQSDNQLLLKNYILLECDKLAASYSSTGIVLKSTSDTGIVLSPYGDLYFRGAVEDLQTLCPTLFFVQTLIPEIMPITTYNMTMEETYRTRLATDDLGKGFTRTGALVGLGGGATSAAITFIGVIGICIWTNRKGWGTEIGMLGGAIITIAMALLVGDIVYTVLMIGSLIAAIGIAWLFLLKKA